MNSSVFELYGGDLTSDALLILKAEAPTVDESSSGPCLATADLHNAAEDQQPSCISMFVHRAVLWRVSEYFQSKIKNWSSADSKPRITMLVPHGQMQIGQHLVAAMYHQLPDQLSQQELLQLLTLAESYKIDKVSSAVGDRISSIPVDKLEWGTVVAAEQLPTDNPVFAPVLAAAEARYMQLLGDLEVVWALEEPKHREFLQRILDPSETAVQHRAEAALQAIHGERVSAMRRSELDLLITAFVAAQQAAIAALSSPVPPHELLLQLPFDKLLGLLSSSKLKVTSENTVYYTLKRWLQRNSASKEQQKQLVAVIRLTNCTPNYIINEVCSHRDTVLPLQRAPADIAEAVAGSIAKKHNISGLLLWRQWLHNLQNARPASALCTLDLEWHIPVADIREAYERTMQEAAQDEAIIEQPHSITWQGLGFKLMLGMNMLADAAAWDAEDIGDVDSIYFQLALLNGDLGRCSSSITVWQIAGPGDQGQQTKFLEQAVPAGAPEFDDMDVEGKVYVLVTESWLNGDGPALPAALVDWVGHNWAEVEQKLRQRQLVHPDGCLHVTAKVTDLY